MALFGIATTASAGYNDMTAEECLSNEFTYKMGKSTSQYYDDWEFKNGGCCEEFDEEDDDCKEDCSGSNDAFCIGKEDGINFRYLHKFLNKMEDEHCRNTYFIEIDESDEPVEMKHKLPGVMPREDAENWHCKWMIKLDSSLVSASVGDSLEDREANGWVVLEAETSGFDKDVIVVMQPPDKFYDYNPRAASTDPNTQTFVGLARAGQKFVLPAEYSVYLDVSPYKLNSNTENEESEEDEGFIKFTVHHTMEYPVPEDPDLKEWAFSVRHDHETNEDGDE